MKQKSKQAKTTVKGEKVTKSAPMYIACFKDSLRTQTDAQHLSDRSVKFIIQHACFKQRTYFCAVPFLEEWNTELDVIIGSKQAFP